MLYVKNCVKYYVHSNSWYDFVNYIFCLEFSCALPLTRVIEKFELSLRMKRKFVAPRRLHSKNKHMLGNHRNKLFDISVLPVRNICLRYCSITISASNWNLKDKKRNCGRKILVNSKRLLRSNKIEWSLRKMCVVQKIGENE